jgi:D-glycero-D-manno-heptose 1,7-bisphosphate phosphatase
MKKNTAVFLDRDGTINEEVGYLDCLSKLKLYDNTAEAIRLINERGIKVVVITNQSGVARGYFTEDFVRLVHSQIEDLLRPHGSVIDAFYFCPHHPTDGIGAYLKSCACRKPEPGMFIRAAQDLNIDLTRSYMIGDTIKDIEAAGRVGAKGILVRTGYGLNAIQEDLPARNFQEKVMIQPACITDDILEAAKWILKDRER